MKASKTKAAGMPHKVNARPRSTKVKWPSKAAMMQWKKNWEMINARDLEDARRMTPQERFDALIMLMNFALEFPETALHTKERAEEQFLWQRIRMAYREKNPSSTQR